MSKILPFWANVLLAITFFAILVAAIVTGKKCDRCGKRLRELSDKDPLAWRGFRITGLPRFRTVRYRCDQCGEDSEVKELTS
jgi:hypothetical protein